MIVKKEAVVKVYTKMIKKFLEQYLPDEDFEYAMIDKAQKIIVEKAGHIKEVL